ncbi:MAG: rod shape-determining protein MreC [Patescibacteria group bacterium]|jgi:rod shape-determining protein MreC
MKFFRRKNPIFVSLLIIISLITLHYLKLTQPLERLLVSATKPLTRKMYELGIRINQAAKDPDSPEQLEARLDQLNQEIAELIVANAGYQELAAENKKLREQLNFLETNDYQYVLASVLARESAIEGAIEGQDLIIDKGRANGLEPGQGVVYGPGLIVGQVVEVKENTAKVCLTTSVGCRLAAAILNQDKTQGVTDGDLGLTVKMEYIPQLEKIAVGDSIITSGLGEKIPRGLVIGRVAEVRSESNNVWQEATIEPLVNLNEITVLSVLIF